MSSDFTDDQGPAEYFHGREEILDTFTSALEYFQSHKSGTIFLIEGAPGAGKTALLHECKKRAEKEWQVATISPSALWSPDDLAECLKEENRTRISGMFTKFGVEKTSSTNAESFETVSSKAHLVGNILMDGKNPLLLILDEAHLLGSKRLVPDRVKFALVGILNEIHNGKLGRPVMLLAAGFETTFSALIELGIVRLEGSCHKSLAGLSREHANAVIRDFLIHKGGVLQPPSRWVETIAGRTHGWPQHIVSYADPAANYLATHGVATDEGLETVLQQGRANQVKFYNDRAEGIGNEQREALARAVMDVPTDGTTTRSDVVASLKQSGLTQNEADDLFTRTRDLGILEFLPDGDYGISIPSFHTWLIDEYGRQKLGSDWVQRS